MFQTEKLRSYFIFTKKELHSIYKEHLASQMKIVELKLHVFVKVIANSKGSIFIDVQRFIKDSIHPKNIEFKKLKNNIIEIIFITSLVDNKITFISSSLEEAKKIINCYSYLQKIGMQIISNSLEKIPRKGISYFFHNTVEMYHGVEYMDIEKLINHYNHLDFILDCYNRSLCEINQRSKLLMLWSLIEDIFFNGKIDFIKQKFSNKSLLTNIEKNEFKQILKNSKLSSNKVKKIIQRVSEIKEKDRNTIIAENISKVLSEDLNIIYTNLILTAKIRCNQAHSTEKSAEKVTNGINFLQLIVEKIIGKIIDEYL